MRRSSKNHLKLFESKKALLRHAVEEFRGMRRKLQVSARLQVKLIRMSNP